MPADARIDGWVGAVPRAAQADTGLRKDTRLLSDMTTDMETTGADPRLENPRDGIGRAVAEVLNAAGV
jgi:hypothetical protein